MLLGAENVAAHDFALKNKETLTKIVHHPLGYFSRARAQARGCGAAQHAPNTHLKLTRISQIGGGAGGSAAWRVLPWATLSRSLSGCSYISK